MSRFRSFEQASAGSLLPGLVFVTVHSPALGQRADITLYVPPQVQADDLHDVPIVLLLHGVYGSHWAWALKGSAHVTSQRLIDDGVLPPLVLAMPSDGLCGLGSGYVRHATQDFERWIVDDVPAAVCQACGACSSASALFIAGLSMGGFGALRLAGRHPQRFAAAAGLSSITDVAQFDALGIDDRACWAAEPQDRSVLASLSTAATLPPLHLSCGRDDALLEANRALHSALREHGIAHAYAEHDGTHGWDYWSRHLEDTLRFFALQLDGVHR